MRDNNEKFIRVAYRVGDTEEYYEIQEYNDDKEKWETVSQYQFFPDAEGTYCLLNFGIVKELLKAISYGHTVFGRVYPIDKN